MTESRERSSNTASATLPQAGGSPIFSTMHYKHLKGRVAHHSTARTFMVICFVSGVLVFFFSSIYVGSSYLQEHLSDEKWGNSLGVRSLPNTRNKLSRWSKENLHVDITDLGRPVVVQGTGADKAAFASQADAKDRARERGRTRGRDRGLLHSTARDSSHDSAEANAALATSGADDNTSLGGARKARAADTDGASRSLAHSQSETEAETEAEAEAEAAATTTAKDDIDVNEELGRAGGELKRAASLRGGAGIAD